MDRIRQAALSRRSSLYRWMLRHYDEFSAALAEAGRPNWQALAEAFAAEGLTDSETKPPTPEGARQTWWRVRKAVEAKRAKAAPRPQSATTIAPSPAQSPEPGKSRFTFKPSTALPPKDEE
jgi:hypothetical protein